MELNQITNRALKLSLNLTSILFFTVFFPSCKSSSDNPLLTDFQPSESCPKTGCVDTATNSAGLTLRLSSQDRYLEGQNKLEITGTCSTANYPENQIDVTVVDLNKTIVNTGIASMNINDSSLSCRDGKFHFVVDASSFAANQPYKVTLSLKGKKDGAIQATSGFATISFNVYRN